MCHAETAVTFRRLSIHAHSAHVMLFWKKRDFLATRERTQTRNDDVLSLSFTKNRLQLSIYILLSALSTCAT